VCSIIISLRCKKEKKKKKSLIDRHTKEKGMVAAMQKPDCKTSEDAASSIPLFEFFFFAFIK